MTASSALAILLLWPRVSHRVPAPFVALVVATVVLLFFGIGYLLGRLFL